jgi:hypothetical protein
MLQGILMKSNFHRTTLAIGCILALGMQTQVLAQGLQSGPDFLRGGEYLTQINKGDETYDPYEIQRSFTFNFDEPTREGIVDVKFDVKADGSVENVEVLGGFYDEQFREQAVNGITGTVFTPATAAGAAIDWPNMEMRIILRGVFLPAMTADMSEDFARLVKLNSDKNFVEAEALANLLLTTKAHSLFDYALLQDQLASTYMGTERVHEALIAMRNATSSSKAVSPQTLANTRLGLNVDSYLDDYLLPEMYIAAMSKRLLIALAMNQTGEALNAYDAITERSPAATDDPFKEQIELVRTTLASENPVGSQIKLVQGKWIFETSTRKVFGVTGLTGQVDSIDISCDGAVKRRMVFTNDTEFGLPAAWENCKLEFQGTDGSTFNLYEYLN